MKKIRVLFLIFFVFVSLSLTAQVNDTLDNKGQFYIHGGYSYLDGVIGADFQYKHWGITGGWTPRINPSDGSLISSVGMGLILYNKPYNKNSLYLKFGVATNSYIEQDSYGYDEIAPMSIIMGGYKFGSEKFALKLGAGYGFSEYGGTWTGEVTLGYTIFK